MSQLQRLLAFPFLMLWRTIIWIGRQLAKFWRWVSNLGIREDYLTQNEARRLILLNQIALILGTALAIRAIAHAVFGSDLMVMLALSLASLLIFSVLLLNAGHLHGVAKLVVIIASSLGGFGVSYLAMGNGILVGSIMTYMTTAVVPFIFYSIRQWPWIAFGVSINVIAFVTTYWLTVLAPRPSNFTEATIDISRFVLWMMVMVATILVVRLFYVSNTRAEARLRQINVELEDAQKDLMHELELAGGVQKNLLPTLPDRTDNFEISVDYRPAAALAGDLYDIIPFSEKRLGVFVADVVGHGVSAALVSMMAKLSLANHAQPESAPGWVLEKMNNDLASHLVGGDFLTAFYGVIDVESKTIHYCNAAHPTGFVFRQGASELVDLEINAAMIGPVANIPFPSSMLSLTAGDRVLLYTDGLTEEKNAKQVEFGEERVCNILLQSSGMNMSTVQSRLLNELHQFKAGASYQDDITMLMVEIG